MHACDVQQVGEQKELEMEEMEVREIASFEERTYMRNGRWGAALSDVQKLAPMAKERSLALLLQSAVAPRLEHVMCRFTSEYCSRIAPWMPCGKATTLAHLMMLSLAPGAVELAKMYVLSSVEFMHAGDEAVKQLASTEFEYFQEEHCFGYTPPWTEMEDATRMFGALMANDPAEDMSVRFRQARV